MFSNLKVSSLLSLSFIRKILYSKYNNQIFTKMNNETKIDLKRKLDNSLSEENNETNVQVSQINTKDIEDKKQKNNNVKRNKREKKNMGKIIEQMDISLNASDYYIENGLRKVYPYNYLFYSYCKGRWKGLTLKELFYREFRYSPQEMLEKRIKNGHLKVNHTIVDLNYILKDGDFITHQIHRHEFPVLAVPISIVHIDDDLLVIDKPPSMPIHPCGKYRLNTVTSILEKENKLSDIHLVHRLDRLTSGVMIIARNKAKAQQMHEKMRNRQFQKEYVCRVVGEFPEGIVEVDQPLETLSHKIGICIVSESGKESKTSFERLSFNGKSSVVLAKPHTGRMHQIRVHLQWLGYPIINDSFYNTNAWGPLKGKNGDYGKSLEDLIKQIDLEHQRTNHIISKDGDKGLNPVHDLKMIEKDRIAIKALKHYFDQDGWKEKVEEYRLNKGNLQKRIEEKFDDCFDCMNPTYDPTPSEQLIYLHALRYKLDDECSFETKMPVWARDSWNED